MSYYTPQKVTEEFAASPFTDFGEFERDYRRREAEKKEREAEERKAVEEARKEREAEETAEALAQGLPDPHGSGCKRCGEDLGPMTGRGRPREFCSTACRTEFNNAEKARRTFEAEETARKYRAALYRLGAEPTADLLAAVEARTISTGDAEKIRERLTALGVEPDAEATPAELLALLIGTFS